MIAIFKIRENNLLKIGYKGGWSTLIWIMSLNRPGGYHLGSIMEGV